MRKDTYELEFEKFLEDENYEAAEDALFSIARAAFEAGWLAAGGEPPRPGHTITFPEKA